jgi:hypothetical protein
LGKPTDADAMNAPDAIAGAFNTRAKRSHGIGGVQNIFTFQQAADGGFADGKRAQDQRAVGDGFIARNAGPALDGAASAGN